MHGVGKLTFVLLIAVGALLAAASVRPTHAAGSDTLALSMANGTTFTYGASPAPQFTVILVLPTPPKANYFRVVSVTLDNGQTFGGDTPTVSDDQLTYTFHVKTVGTAIPVGTRTATAMYTEPSTGVTVHSNAVNFTITKATPSLECTILNFTALFSPGQTLRFGISFLNENPAAPVDWQHGTYTIKFVGPTTVKTPGLIPDSSDVVTVGAPTQVGRYTEVECIFSGTALFRSAVGSTTGQQVLVSEKHHLGSVELFTDPTTLVAHRPADAYVVFHAAPGLPTPTGYFSFRLGNAYTPVIALDPGGTSLVHITQIPSLAGVTRLQLSYQGDPHYNTAVLYFPLTNPPIPGSPGTPTPTPTPAAAPTATSAATPTTAPDEGGVAGATPTSTASPTVLTARGAPSENHGAPWLMMILGLLVVGGGAGGVIAVSLRAKLHAGSSSRAPFTSSPSSVAAPEADAEAVTVSGGDPDSEPPERAQPVI
jgi:hypothetical protein